VNATPPPSFSGWDVFVSHCHADEAAAAALTGALSSAGLRVFRAVGGVDTFDSISAAVLGALRDSTVLVACYSAEYPTRPACQHEFAVAYLAGAAEGYPLGRALAVNLARSLDHVQPRQLRDALLPAGPLTEARLGPVVDAVVARVGALRGPIGEVAATPPRWLGGRVDPPAEFVGRWRELWALHSALHPDVAPLTSRPGSPLVVVHGPMGIGKTALAAEYVRLLGPAFPGGIVWGPTGSAARDRATDGATLWVVDDVAGEPAEVAARLPAPGTPCLVLTRDPRLAALGTPLPLDDLTAADAALSPSMRPAWANRLHEATLGSPRLRHRLAELAATSGIDDALLRLHAPTGELLRPLADHLRQELATDPRVWDAARVLAAASPTPLTLPDMADAVATANGTDRTTELLAVRAAVTALQTRGFLAGPADAVAHQLPAALTLALRHADPAPERAEQLRATTLRTLATRHAPAWLPQPQPTTNDDPAVRAAARRLRIELTSRITTHPLPENQGSLHRALRSLYQLTKLTREIQAALPPSPTTQPLDDLATHLREDLLRPLLTRWHPHLPKNTNEETWPHHEELRKALAALPPKTQEIANSLRALEDP